MFHNVKSSPLFKIKAQAVQNRRNYEDCLSTMTFQDVLASTLDRLRHLAADIKLKSLECGDNETEKGLRMLAMYFIDIGMQCLKVVADASFSLEKGTSEIKRWYKDLEQPMENQELSGYNTRGLSGFVEFR
jgi:hypothetical protein